MNLRLIYSLLFLSVFLTNTALSQDIKTQKPYKFMYGLSWNAIDDDGRPFRELLRFRPRWNMFALPTTLSLDYYHKDGMSFEGIMSFFRILPSA